MVAIPERHHSHSEQTEQQHPVEHSTRAGGTAHETVDLRSPDVSDTIKRRMQLPGNEESHTLTQGFEVGPPAGHPPVASDVGKITPVATAQKVGQTSSSELSRVSSGDDSSIVLTPAPGKRAGARADQQGEGAVVSVAEALSLGAGVTAGKTIEAPGRVTGTPIHAVDTSAQALDAPAQAVFTPAKLVDPAHKDYGKAPDTAFNVVEATDKPISTTWTPVADLSGKALIDDSSKPKYSAVGLGEATAVGDYRASVKVDPAAPGKDAGWISVGEVVHDNNRSGWTKVVDIGNISVTEDGGRKGSKQLDLGNNVAISVGDNGDKRWIDYKPVKQIVDFVVGNNASVPTGEKHGAAVNDKAFKKDGGTYIDVTKPDPLKFDIKKDGGVVVNDHRDGQRGSQNKDDDRKVDVQKFNPSLNPSLSHSPSHSPRENNPPEIRRPDALKIDRQDRFESFKPISKPDAVTKSDLERKDAEPKLKPTTSAHLEKDQPIGKPNPESNLKLVSNHQGALPLEGKGEKQILPLLKDPIPPVSSQRESVQERSPKIKDFQQRLDDLVASQPKIHLQILIGKNQPDSQPESDRRSRRDKVEEIPTVVAHQLKIPTRLELLDQTRRSLVEVKNETGTRRSEPQEFKVIDRALKGGNENTQGKREEIQITRTRDGKAEPVAETRIPGKADIHMGGKKESDTANPPVVAPKGPGIVVTEEDPIKKKGKKLFGEDEDDANLQIPPEETKRKPDEDVPQVVMVSAPLAPVDSRDEKEPNQAQILEEELDAEERRQRNLAMLAAAAANAPNSNDPNQTQQQSNSQPTAGGGNCPQVDPSTILPTIELTDPTLDSTVHIMSDQNQWDQQQVVLENELEQRYDIEQDAYAEHAATIQAMRERELLGYEMREQEQRQERERLEEERNARRQRDLEENQRRLTALLAQKRKAAQMGSDKISNPRITYVIQPGDTLEAVARRMLGDKRLSGLIFELNRSSIPWRIESGRRYLALKPGLTIQLPNHVDITRYKSSKRTTTLPFGYEAVQATTSSATTTTLPSEQAARQKSRRENIEKVLGSLGKSEDKDECAYCIARLGETLNTLARRHPLLQDESLWPLLAEINHLSQETDVLGKAKAKLVRGSKLRLPSKEQILEYRLRTCKPAEETTQPPRTAIADTGRNLTSEYVFLDQNARLLVTRDQDSMTEVQYSLQVFVADWQPVRTYQESYSGSWVRHEFDRFGAVKSIALDLPVSVIKELAHNDLYGAWEVYASEYLAVATTKTA